MRLQTVTVSTLIIIGLTLQYTYASCHWREIDLCLATLAVYANVYGIVPSTEEELDVACRYMREAVDCARDFTRQCTTEDLFDTTYIIAQSTHQYVNKMCKKGSELQKEWLKRAPCIASYFNETKPCIDYALAGIENLGKIPSKDRFPTLCCVFNNIMHCISEILNEKCEENSEEMVKIMMRNIVSDVPIIACKEFKPKSKQCVSLLPPPGTKSKGKDSDSEIVKLMSDFLSI